MKELKEILNELETLLKKSNYPIFNYLQEGKKDNAFSDVEELFDSLKFPVREDIVEMYKWKNGVRGIYQTAIGKLELFTNGIMLPFEYAVSSYALEVKTQKLFGKEYFPLFTSGGGDYIIMNMDNKNNSFGQLFLFSPSVLLTNKPISIYDSLTSLFKTVLELYIKKGYFFESEDLEIDYDLEKEISITMNPKSKFWIEN